MTEETKPGEKIESLYQEALSKAKNKAPRVDVITLSNACRDGAITARVMPAMNGFTVMLEPVNAPQAAVILVYPKANKVGHLMKALYVGNLENEEVLTRLRRLLFQ